MYSRITNPTEFWSCFYCWKLNLYVTEHCIQIFSFIFYINKWLRYFYRRKLSLDKLVKCRNEDKETGHVTNDLSGQHHLCRFEQVIQGASTLSTAAVMATPLQVNQRTSPPISTLLYCLPMGSAPPWAAATHASMRWLLEGKLDPSFFILLSASIPNSRMAKPRLFLADLAPARELPELHVIMKLCDEAERNSVDNIWECDKHYRVFLISHLPALSLSRSLEPSQRVVHSRHSNVFVEWMKAFMRWKSE